MEKEQKNEDTYTQVLAKQEEETVNENLGKRVQEKYQYLNAGHYKEQLKIRPKEQKAGEELIKKGWIYLDEVEEGYLSDSGEQAVQFFGTGTEKYQYPYPPAGG